MRLHLIQGVSLDLTKDFKPIKEIDRQYLENLVGEPVPDGLEGRYYKSREAGQGPWQLEDEYTAVVRCSKKMRQKDKEYCLSLAEENDLFGRLMK